jgi:hypothetical protein
MGKPTITGLVAREAQPVVQRLPRKPPFSADLPRRDCLVGDELLQGRCLHAQVRSSLGKRENFLKPGNMLRRRF